MFIEELWECGLEYRQVVIQDRKSKVYIKSFVGLCWIRGLLFYRELEVWMFELYKYRGCELDYFLSNGIVFYQGKIQVDKK